MDSNSPSVAHRQLSRRPAVQADIPYLFQLRLQSMQQHLVAAGWILDEAQHRERILDQLDSAEILLVEGSPVGMIKIAREAGHWHIMQLQVAPAMHGSGIGTDVLRAVIGEANAANARLTLGVLKVNPARRLYERMGFVIDGETDSEYEMTWRGMSVPQ